MQSDPINSKTIYRPRGNKTVRASFSIEEEVQAKLTKIRDAFQTRFPKDQYPSLSAILEVTISRCYQDLLNNPEWLDAEVNEFQRRYKK